MILGQEDAHHSFGLARFDALLENQPIPDRLQQRSQDYLELLESLVYSLSDLFHYFDENSADYLNEFQAGLPDWISVQHT